MRRIKTAWLVFWNDMHLRLLRQDHVNSGRGKQRSFLFLRAPKGLALRRYQVGFYHVATAPQSYSGGFGLRASAAGRGGKDALAERRRIFVG